MTTRDELQSLWQKTYPASRLTGQETAQSFRTRSLALAETRVFPSSKGDETTESFRRLAALGEGGMGIVYRARQQSLRREVALKTLKGAEAERFLSEALVTAYLDHPNIVPVYELQSDGEGRPEIAMKLIEGQTWTEHLAADRPWDRPDKLDEHLETLLIVCNAIAFAHVKGIVHLDLKPDNVMLGAFNEVLVLDWGLAHEIGAPSKERRAPHASALVEPCGTPNFMPPELVLGDGARIDERSDVYLLGGLLHTVLTGKPPHRGRRLLDILLDAAEGPPPELPGAPPELKSIARRALAKDPAQRFPTALAMIEELRGFRAHRESLLLAEKAQRDLEAAETEDGYDALRRALAGFEQSLALWSQNAEAERGRLEAHRRSAALALASQDLALARDHIDRLGESGDALKSELAEAEAAIARERRRQAWVRSGLGAALLAILLGLGYYTRALQASEREARESRAAAQDAADLAERRQESERQASLRAREAEARARRSEAVAERRRKQAESALVEARRNLGQVYFQIGREAIKNRDFGAAELSLSRALTLDDSPEARSALAATGGLAPAFLRSLRSQGNEIVGLRFDANDRRLCVISRSPAEPAEPSASLSVFYETFEIAEGRRLDSARIDEVPADAPLDFDFRPGGDQGACSWGDKAWLRDLDRHIDLRRFKPAGGESSLADILTLRFDQSGRRLAVCRIGGADIIDLSSGERAALRCAAVDFPPGAPSLIRQAEDGGLDAYADDGRRLARFCAPDAYRAEPFEASRDGLRVLLGSVNAAAVWAQDETRLGEIKPARGDRFTQLLLNAEGNLVGACSLERPQALELHQARDGLRVARFASSEDRISAVTFGRQAPLLAVALGHRVLIFEIGELQRAYPRVDGLTALDTLQLLPGGRMAAFGRAGAQDALRLWHCDNGARLPDPTRILGRRRHATMSFSPDGGFLAVVRSGIPSLLPLSGEDPTRLPSEFEVYAEPDAPPPTTSPEDAAWLRVRIDARRQYQDRLRNHTSRKLTFEPLSGREKQKAALAEISLRCGYRGLRFSPRGLLLALGTFESHLWSWERKASSLLARLPAASDADFLSEDRVLLLKDEELITFEREGSGFREVHRQRVTRGKRSATRAPVGIALAADRSRFLTVSESAELQVWDARSGEPRRLDYGARTLSARAIGPRGRLIALGFDSGEIRLYKAESLALIGSYQASRSEVRSLMISPEAGLIGHRSRGRGLRLWNLPFLLRAFTARPEELYQRASARLGLELDGFKVRAR